MFWGIFPRYRIAGIEGGSVGGGGGGEVVG